MAVFVVAAPAFGKSSGSHSSSHTSSSSNHSTSHSSSGHSSHTGSGHHSSTSSSHSHSKADPGVARDKNGHIKRSTKAKDEFKHGHPCPSTGKTSGSCPGYVIDHVQALKHGGADKPENMQWQTVEAAKAKDKVE